MNILAIVIVVVLAVVVALGWVYAWFLARICSKSDKAAEEALRKYVEEQSKQ